MLELTDQNFGETIQKADKPVLVDYMAIWCFPCTILSPILEKLEKDFEGKAIFARVNVDAAPETSQKFEINPIPTVILFKNGKPVGGFIGVKPEPEIKKWLEENLKVDSEKIDPVRNFTGTSITETKISEISNGVEEIIKEYEEYAEKNNFQLNPDREVVKRIIKGLLENEKKYGFRYCPCRRIAGNLEEDRPKICPCAWHRMEIEKQGHCLCNLFFRK